MKGGEGPAQYTFKMDFVVAFGMNAARAALFENNSLGG
jgi:hypothetical protein